MEWPRPIWSVLCLKRLKHTVHDERVGIPLMTRAVTYVNVGYVKVWYANEPYVWAHPAWVMLGLLFLIPGGGA